VDNQWVTIGSFNLNYTSYQQNLEMNVNIYSEKLNGEIQKIISTIVNEGCLPITSKSFMEKSSVSLKMQRFFYYMLLSIIANFSIGLIYQEEKEAQDRFLNLLRIISALTLFCFGIICLFVPLFPGTPFIMVSFLLIFKNTFIRMFSKNLSKDEQN
jgi:cardiolipin synthase